MARAAPAADRATSIISLLTAHPSRAFTLTEIVRALGMNIASAHATLAALSDCGFLVRDPTQRTYVLGPALAATGFSVLEVHPTIRAAIEQADKLSRSLKTEVSVATVAGRDTILLSRSGSTAAAATNGYPGDRTPLLAPFGAVFMAWADPAKIDTWLARTDASESEAEHYHEALEAIRTRGFSVTLSSIAQQAVEKAITRVRRLPASPDAEHDLSAALHTSGEMLMSLTGVTDPASTMVSYRSVSAPIFDHLGQVLLAIGAAGSGAPQPLGAVLEVGREVAEAAAAATRRGRGRVPTIDATVATRR